MTPLSLELPKAWGAAMNDTTNASRSNDRRVSFIDSSLENSNHANIALSTLESQDISSLTSPGVD
jgi:hypothetical protein